MRTCTYVAVLLVSYAVTSLPTGAESVDRLKPKHHRQERELRQLMESLSRVGLDYQLEVEYKRFEDHFLGHQVVARYTHCVTLPGKIGKQVENYDWRFVMGNFTDYLNDPKFSFYASLLLIDWLQTHNSSPGRFGAGYSCPFKLEPLETHDKDLWDNNLQKYAAPFLATFGKDCHSHKQRLFFEVIPDNYLKCVFVDYIYFEGASIIEKPLAIKGKLSQDAVREFDASGSTAKMLEMSLTKENLGVWLYLTISDAKTNRLEVVKDFCAWCRKSEPKKNLFLSAVAMGIFIVDGYSFDEEKGTYQPNDRGRQFLDYVVEFPIPENGTRLKIIMDGGNKEAVEDLMKKHDVVQAWQDLLKNPVEPKFEEFKQRPMPKRP